MTSTSSIGRQSFAATGTSSGEPMFSLNEVEKFGHKELEETYQQLVMDGHPTETQQPNDEVHVLRNVINELVKENQRLSQKIDNMETTQGKMLIILLDLKNNHLNGHANIQVAAEPLRKKNYIPVIHAPDVQTMTNEGKSNANLTKKIHGLKGISSVIICDDEGEAAEKDDFGSSVSQGKGKSVAIEHQNRGDSRVPMNVNVVDPTNVFKKLSFTPSPSSSKRRNPPTPLNKRTEPPLRIPGSSSKNFKLDLQHATLPKYLKCKFEPVKPMDLRPEEAVLCLYMFSDYVDDCQQSPTVIKVGDYCWGLRSDFQCMIPEGYVGDRTQIDMKTSEDVLEKMFGSQFMPPFQHLKYIYVPIEDHELFHWYLMVINIPLRKIYHLDTNMVDSTIKKKHDKIRAVAKALSIIALTIYDVDVPNCIFPDFEGWEIVEPHGIPNYGHSNNCGLWVAEWLQMQNSFNNQVVGGTMDESIMRMRMVMALLLGAHNECRELILEAANALWLDLHVKHDLALNLKRQRRTPQGRNEMH
ncbi:hypothetical protein TSUD_211020 [Trifolium subterraneum]|uniref:Ubiquitin-like protease family profile domain-containing protein n=1 Tax=Trifolium subterraneum TaxID=3900 RepID=A0A2Z6N8H6_TRISU|nr:hypothetical protein TSUD_211020 [Trifolium subterraneum]